MSDIEAPVWWESREFQQSAGRALMRWWNEHGPSLPAPGEVYRAWWKSTMEALSNDWIAPGDVFEQLRMYAEEARQWWEDEGRRGPKPPSFSRRPVLTAGVTWTVATVFVGAVVLAILLRE